VVENPDRELERLLREPLDPEMLAKFEGLLSKEKMSLKQSIQNRGEEFKKRYGIVFSEGMIDLIVNRMIEKGFDVNTVLEEVAEVQRRVDEFERDFLRRHGIHLHFKEEAIKRITEIALEEDESGSPTCSICVRLSKDYEHGFRLIRDKTGQNEFIITIEAVDDPEEFLKRMIREVYSRSTDQIFEDRN
jgi:hypothetical protein